MATPKKTETKVVAQPTKEIEITKLEDFTKLVEDNVKKTNGEHDMFCYRGVASSTYKLVPGLYRHPDTNIKIEQLLKHEYEIFLKFLHLGKPMFPVGLDFGNADDFDFWESLFFMQHWGFPTRLLDWSQNPYVALFFALSEAKNKIDEKKAEKPDAAVWVLNAVQWNRFFLSGQGYKEGVLSVGHASLDNYKSKYTVIDRLNNFPVAMYGIHNNARISVQKGMFVIFGKDVLPMEEQVKKAEKPEDLLYKVIIKHDNIENLFKTLYSIGFTDSFVYPDLHGLAYETRRDFGFRVGG